MLVFDWFVQCEVGPTKRCVEIGEEYPMKLNVEVVGRKTRGCRSRMLKDALRQELALYAG